MNHLNHNSKTVGVGGLDFPIRLVYTFMAKDDEIPAMARGLNTNNHFPQITQQYQISVSAELKREYESLIQ